MSLCLTGFVARCSPGWRFVCVSRTICSHCADTIYLAHTQALVSRPGVDVNVKDDSGMETRVQLHQCETKASVTRHGIDHAATHTLHVDRAAANSRF